MKKIDTKTFSRVLVSIISIIGLHYMVQEITYDNLIYPIAFLIFYITYKKWIKYQKTELIYSFISSFIFVIGQEIYYNHNLHMLSEKPILYGLVFLGVSSLFYILYSFIRIGYEKRKEKKNTKIWNPTKKQKIVMISGIVLSHIICYLSYFPGLYNYDITTQEAMILRNIPFSNFHPILHTVMWWVFMKIEKVISITNIGVILYTLFQLAIVIGTYLIFLDWSRKRNFSKKYIILSYLYFTLNPILLVFSLCTTKDVLFAMFLLLFLMSIVDLWDNCKKNNIIKFIGLGILCTLFRNNMFYVILVLLPILLFFKNKTLTISTLAIIFATFTFNNIICPRIGVGKGLMQEMMSIPLSQMSYVYLYEDTYSASEKLKIEEYVPGIEEFNPRFADLVKHNFNEEKFKSSKKEFIGLYLKGLKEHPYRYFYIFLDMNIVYWYPNAQTVDPFSQRTYIEDRTYNSFIHNKVQKNIFPFNLTYDYFHRIATFSSPLQHLPILSNFFLLNFSFWFMILSSFVYTLTDKKKSFIIVLIVPFLLFLTYLLGPVSNFRYVYPYYVIMPLLIGLLQYDKKKEDEKV